MESARQGQCKCRVCGVERYTRFLVNELSSNFRQSDPTPPKYCFYVFGRMKGKQARTANSSKHWTGKQHSSTKKQISDLAFLLICHRFSPLKCCLSVVLQLDKRDYPENLQVAICPNKRPSFEPFTHHSKPKFSALHSNHPILSFSLSNNKTALV